MNTNEIFFIGGVFDEKNILDRSQAGVQFASNTLQWVLIKGLQELTPLKILNSVYVGTFPKYHKHVYEKNYTWEYEGKIKVTNVGFINLFLIKNIHRAINMSIKLINDIRKSKKPKIVIVYGMHSPFIMAALLSKVIWNNIHLSIIITDLPIYMSQSKDKGKVFSFFKHLDSKILFSLVKGFDSFVLLTEEMKKPLNIEDKLYVVVEGAVDEKKAEIIEKYNCNVNDKKIILYTGNLNTRNGINNLVDAFNLINDERFELWICGEGDEGKNLQNLAINNNRVKYYGLVSKEIVFELQSKATVLVNPRQDLSGEYTKYSFPSKTMEYLLSGKPVVAYKLAGIPNDYDDYIIYVDNNSVEAFSKKLHEICMLGEEDRDRIGYKGQEFVINNKSGVAQAEKILEMICKY